MGLNICYKQIFNVEVNLMKKIISKSEMLENEKKNFNNVEIRVAGRKIDKEALENRKSLTFLEKIRSFNIVALLLNILLVPFFLGSIVLIGTNPLNFFGIFENAVRVQLLSMLGIMIVVWILHAKINRYYLSKYKILFFVLLVGGVFYYMSIPADYKKKVLSKDEFKIAMSDLGYSVSFVDDIENLTINNSEIILAEKDGIKEYYILSEKSRNIKKTYDSFQEEDFSDCLVGGQGSISGNHKDSWCQNPYYLKVIYKIKNSLVYVEAQSGSKEKIQELLKNLGYAN